MSTDTFAAIMSGIPDGTPVVHHGFLPHQNDVQWSEVLPYLGAAVHPAIEHSPSSLHGAFTKLDGRFQSDEWLVSILDLLPFAALNQPEAVPHVAPLAVSFHGKVLVIIPWFIQEGEYEIASGGVIDTVPKLTGHGISMLEYRFKEQRMPTNPCTTNVRHGWNEGGISIEINGNDDDLPCKCFLEVSLPTRLDFTDFGYGCERDWGVYLSTEIGKWTPSTTARFRAAARRNMYHSAYNGMKASLLQVTDATVV